MTLSSKFTENKALNRPATTAVTSAIHGKVLEIGSGFRALAFREKDFSGAMDPLVMVDHYRMTESTFGAHPHAGLSAVSVLFEDSEGEFHNRDSLGNDFNLMPGDLYWLKAGSGVVHDEAPRPGAKIHGLQVFVNLPAAFKKSEPKSLHVKAQNIPIYEENGIRVRIVLGMSNGIAGPESPALPMTILDGRIDSGARFSHQLQGRENAWIYAIKGELQLTIEGRDLSLSAGQSIAVSQAIGASETRIQLSNGSTEPAHFALFSAEPIKEAFVQKGPFVMSSEEDIAQVEADFAAGKLGHLAS